MEQSLITDTWHHCYDEGLQQLIVPEAFSHPAKMAWGLAQRIMAHLGECWPDARDGVLLDPMAGIGTVGLAGAYAGYRTILGELEYEFSTMSGGRACAGVTLDEWKRYWVKPRRVRYFATPEAMRRWCPWCRRNLHVGATRYLQTRAAHRYTGTIALHADRLQALGKPLPLLFRHDAQALPLGSAGCVVTSPPFADIVAGQDKTFAAPHDTRATLTTDYGTHPAQLGNLRAVVSSPPYENSVHGRNGIDMSKLTGTTGPRSQAMAQGYGESAQQLQAGVYWSAMSRVYRECARVLPPGAPMILVVKGYISKGAYVDLPMQTAQLLEDCGFTMMHWHEASLVSRESQLGLFGGETRRERKSFFRRLAERNGAPPIDAEIVLCAERG